MLKRIRVRLPWDDAILHLITGLLALFILLPLIVVVLGAFLSPAFLGLSSEQ